MPRTTIVLADDHPVVLQGLRRLLETERDFTIVGEVSDGLAVLGLVERLRPNVLVLDLMMPEMNGLAVTREVSHRFPKTRVLILSMHASDAYVVEALRSGATGYVLKDANEADLIKAVRDVAAGRRYLSPPLAERAIEAYGARGTTEPIDPYETLTARERQIFQLTAEGASAAQIATTLSISPRTAETHRANLMRKLGLHSQAELIRYAVRRGILQM